MPRPNCAGLTTKLEALSKQASGSVADAVGALAQEGDGACGKPRRIIRSILSRGHAFPRCE